MSRPWIRTRLRSRMQAIATRARGALVRLRTKSWGLPSGSALASAVRTRAAMDGRDPIVPSGADGAAW